MDSGGLEPPTFSLQMRCSTSWTTSPLTCIFRLSKASCTKSPETEKPPWGVSFIQSVNTHTALFTFFLAWHIRIKSDWHLYKRFSSQDVVFSLCSNERYGYIMALFFCQEAAQTLTQFSVENFYIPPLSWQFYHATLVFVDRKQPKDSQWRGRSWR